MDDFEKIEFALNSLEAEDPRLAHDARDALRRIVNESMKTMEELAGMKADAKFARLLESMRGPVSG